MVELWSMVFLERVLWRSEYEHRISDILYFYYW